MEQADKALYQAKQSGAQSGNNDKNNGEVK